VKVRERKAGTAVDSLRLASGSVRTAISRLSEVSTALLTECDGIGVVEEAREQLVAAMHLIDGVGLALRRNGL
jgi:hypothetical protein